MKKLTRSELTKVMGGNYPSTSSCSVKCANGKIGSKDCGNGVDCLADPARESVWCGGTEYCVCDGVV